jgi:hypothetical protein
LFSTLTPSNIALPTRAVALTPQLSQAKAINMQVLEALLADPKRTFAAEHSVYWRLLWTTANTTTRDAIRALVQRGQLEFAGGGWVQTDEAITWVGDTIDQFALGHLWIQSALNTNVHTAWQVGPPLTRVTVICLWK